MASAKAAARDLELTTEKCTKMIKGAESALNLGDEATAREAIEAQLKLESEKTRREAALAVAEEAYAAARAAREETQNQLREIRGKKDELLTRARVAASQEKIQRTVSGPATSTGSILDAVSAIEGKVEEKEATLAVRRELAGAGAGTATASLERRIDAANTSAEVDRRLAALKSNLNVKES